MLFRLRPCRRVYRQDQKLAFGKNGGEGMQQLHPGRQRGRLRDERGVDGGCRPEGYGKPENCAADDKQRAARREPAASHEDPRHSPLKGVMHGFFEGAITYLLPQPGPISAHQLAPLLAPGA